MVDAIHNAFQGELPEKIIDKNTPKVYKKEIDKWFRSIHLTNAEQSLNQMRDFVSTTNYRVFDDEDDRLYLLNLLHEPALSAAAQVKHKYLHTQFPLSETERAYAFCCIHTYQQLIIGHLIILFEQLEQQKSIWKLFKHSQRDIAASLQRITRYLSQIVLTYFEIYDCAPKDVWIKLYTIFHYAESLDIDDILLPDPLIKGKSSIKFTFLQGFLLALSDPYHFNQQQIYYIYRQLAQWSKWIDVTAKKDIDHKHFRAINLCDNYMPTFYPRGKEPEQDDYTLFLDSHRLKLELLMHDQESSVGFLSPKIKQGVLRQIQTSLSIFSERHHQRHEFFSELSAVLGLNSVHYALNKYQHPTWLNPANFESKLKDEESLDYDSLVSALSYKKKKNIEWNFKIEQFYTENESTNGLSLIWTHEHSISLKIGDLMTLSQEILDRPSNWFIGVVRRIQHRHHQPLRVGIQILSPKGAKAINIRRKNTTKNYRAIFIPACANFFKHDTILTDALTFSSKEKLMLSDSLENIKNNTINEQEIELLDNIETTSYFMHFRFDFLAQR